MYYSKLLEILGINEIFTIDFLQLLPIIVGVFIAVITAIFAILFLLKRRRKKENGKTYEKAPAKTEPKIPEPKISNEEVMKELNNLSKEVFEIKKYLRDLTAHLEHFLARVPSLAGALSKYSITPINNLREAVDYLNLNEIVIFLDTGLPLESYPLPVDEKRTGILMEIYRSTKELYGEKIQGVTLLMPEETMTIYEVKVEDRSFYVAYKAKAGIEESLLGLQRTVIEDYVKKRIRELSE